MQPQSQTFETILRIIKEYAENFPRISGLITEKEWEQISWIDGTFATSEKAAEYKEDKINIQVKRILARLNCLQLLRIGNEVEYQEFIIGQKEPILKREEFNALSFIIQSLSPIEYQTLWVATTIAVSVNARSEAEKKLPNEPLPFDSVEFLAKVMTEAPETYPAAAQLLSKYDESSQVEIKRLLDSMFNTAHGRHLMYEEGNLKMLQKMGEKVVTNKFSRCYFEIWFAYWLIDVTGFRGHIDNRGSVYLTHNTYVALSALKNALAPFISSSGSEEDKKLALRNYLIERARLLGFINKEAQPPSQLFAQPSSEILALTKVACMMRFFTPEEGIILKQAMQKLQVEIPAEDYTKLAQVLNPLTDSPYPTPTYVPALFQNLFDRVAASDKVEAIKMSLKIYIHVFNQYEEQCRSIAVEARQPLNFNAISMAIGKAEDLEKILKTASEQPIRIDEKGVASISSREVSLPQSKP